MTCSTDCDDDIQGQILTKVLGHRAAVTFFSLAVIVLNFQGLATLQASSRFLWALSRDQAIPFSNVFYRVSRDKLPVAATWLAVALAAPMTAVLWIAPAIVPSVLYSASGTFLMFAYVSPRAGGHRFRLRVTDGKVAPTDGPSASHFNCPGRFIARISIELEFAMDEVSSRRVLSMR